MSEWEAPAKLNLDLRVSRADAAGMHPLRSLVQSIEWCDRLTVEAGDEDHLEVEGADLPEGGENLVWKAVDALGLASRPPLHFRLDKRVAVTAGLGGGSSDAAATLLAVADLLGAEPSAVAGAAPRVGADVPFFLVGGTAIAEGYGERLTSEPALTGFAVAVAVPPFELPTPDVYRRWDSLEGPVGPGLDGAALPPSLRRYDELRNDLTPAAVDLRPDLADWMRDLEGRWDRPVLMSGSGPACFAFFLDEDEASDAVGEVAESRAAVAAGLRGRGAARVD